MNPIISDQHSYNIQRLGGLLMFNSEPYCPIISMAPPEEPHMDKKADGDINFDLNYFMSDDAIIPPDDITIKAKEEKKKKSTTAKKTVTVTPVDPTQIQGSTKVPYADSYAETNAVLRNTVLQADQLLSEVKDDIDKIRASKTLKNKYTYLTNLTASAAAIIGSKISAIREQNNTITQGHNLELKRAKDLKEFEQNDKNDDARMMDLYNAFIHAPYGMYDNGLNVPTIPNMMLGTNDPNPTVSSVSMVPSAPHDVTLTPEQIRMRFENDPSIEEVVKYDMASGRKWFEVINKTTGEVVPNYPTSDPFLLDGVSIDSRAGIAKNRNLDKVWNLVQVGTVSEY